MNVGYWPGKVAREATREAFVRAYGTLGYQLCSGGELEAGLEKIALYGIGQPGQEEPTHAALQLPSGEWTSKLGDFEDIKHTMAIDVQGPIYGRVLCYLARPR